MNIQSDNNKGNSDGSLVEETYYPASKFSSFCFDWLESLVQALSLVMILFAFFFRIMTVDGTSMLNTLYDNDRVCVWKWNYTPKAGDVVTITRGENLDKPIVKRIIATEGQTLSIDFSTGSVTVDGKVLNETYIKEPMWLQEDGDIPDVIPKGRCFVMGDNRNNSLDSRSKAVGLIDNNDIIGKVQYIVFPFERISVVN